MEKELENPVEEQPTDGEQVEKTQKELDKAFAQRAKQAKESAIKSVLESLGVEKLDDAVELITKQRQAEDEKKTEIEKAQEKVREFEEKYKHALSEIESYSKKVENTKIETAILLSANDFIDPQDALKNIDRENIKLNENGEVVGVEDALKSLREKKPHYLKQAKDTHGTPRPNFHNKQQQGQRVDSTDALAKKMRI